ncbi:TIGR02444 family protein [Marinobacter fonticola]|uniref:TIGR02444 family protein n=1 Tax=Marinobacter fonticola TaxID=2603215 RepID=UPI00143D6B1A|nr:TIGR02444 family protein [Marinobacter fonticola]
MHPPDDLLLDNPFWQFALGLWRDKDIAQSCLDLQHGGWSVSRILTAAWLARHEIEWNGEETKELAQWRSRYTETLRLLRQQLIKGTPADSLRNRIKQAELEAERIELAWIYQSFRQRFHNVSRFSGYNETLLIRNLRAAAPNGGNLSVFEDGMNRFSNALQHADPAAPTRCKQGSNSQ